MHLLEAWGVVVRHHPAGTAAVLTHWCLLQAGTPTRRASARKCTPSIPMAALTASQLCAPLTGELAVPCRSSACTAEVHFPDSLALPAHATMRSGQHTSQTAVSALTQAAPGADAPPGALLPGVAAALGPQGAGPGTRRPRPLAAVVPECAHLGRRPSRLIPPTGVIGPATCSRS